MRPARLLPALLFLAATTALGACDPLSLNPATIDNRVDSVRIWAVNGTPVSLPSGYDVTLRSRVRLDQVTTFDFVYAIAPDGGHVFLPIAAIAPTGRTTGNPGLLATTTPFDSITVAQQVGYVTNDTLPGAVGGGGAPGRGGAPRGGPRRTGSGRGGPRSPRKWPGESGTSSPPRSSSP